MLLADLDNILFAHQRLAAGVDVEEDTDLLALLDDAVDLIEGEVQLVAVFRGPAAGAVEVAGGGRIKKNGPRSVAVILVADIILPFPSDEGSVEDEVHEKALEDAFVKISGDMEDIIVIGVLRVIDGGTDVVALILEAVSGEPVNPVHKLRQVLFRVFDDFVYLMLDGELRHFVLDVHSIFSFAVNTK